MTAKEGLRGHLWVARKYTDVFTGAVSLHPHCSTIKYLLGPPFYRWGHWGSEKLFNVPVMLELWFESRSFKFHATCTTSRSVKKEACWFCVYFLRKELSWKMERKAISPTNENNTWQVDAEGGGRFLCSIKKDLEARENCNWVKKKNLEVLIKN